MFITSKNKNLSNDMKIFGTCSIPLRTALVEKDYGSGVNLLNFATKIIFLDQLWMLAILVSISFYIT